MGYGGFLLGDSANRDGTRGEGEKNKKALEEKGNKEVGTEPFTFVGSSVTSLPMFEGAK